MLTLKLIHPFDYIANQYSFVLFQNMYPV